MRISDWSSDVCSSDLQRYGTSPAGFDVPFPSQSPVGPQPDGGFFMRALPIVITAALLAGCAAQPTQTVWARLDGTKATQAQLAQDEAACRYEAAQPAYQRPERRPHSAYYSNPQIGHGFTNLEEALDNRGPGEGMSDTCVAAKGVMQTG